MLNPAYSRDAVKDSSGYTLSKQLSKEAQSANAEFDTGPELRTQEVFTYEIWRKFEKAGLEPGSFKSKNILDLCAGTGFLSYHLLKRVSSMESLTLLDISDKDLGQAKKIIKAKSVDFCVGDATNTHFPSDYFDYVIGNSFLHHFYNLPRAVKEIYRILKPGGKFITLHEPLIPALALEKASAREYLHSLISPSNYLESLRYRGTGLVQPGAGADIWIFNNRELKNIFLLNGFSSVKTNSWNLTRPYTVERLNLHLNSKRNELNKNEIDKLYSSIQIDSTLNKILPSRFFGSIVLLAEKK